MQIYGPAHVHGPQAVSAPHTHAGCPVHLASGVAEDSRRSQHLRCRPLGRAGQAGPGHSPGPRAGDPRQIASGTYETTGKLDVAVNRLLDEIG